jgi:hypothetical protein
MQAVVLAELVPETAEADRAAAADRAEVAGPVEAADRVEVVGPAEAAEQFRRIQSTPRVSSNPEVPVKFNKSSLLLGLILPSGCVNFPTYILGFRAVDGKGAELINSCEPNLKLRKLRGRLWLFSLRRIRAGEELYYDYGFSKSGKRVCCQCGAASCRGAINRS